MYPYASTLPIQNPSVVKKRYVMPPSSLPLPLLLIFHLAQLIDGFAKCKPVSGLVMEVENLSSNYTAPGQGDVCGYGAIVAVVSTGSYYTCLFVTDSNATLWVGAAEVNATNGNAW